MKNLTTSLLLVLALHAGAADYADLKNQFCDASNKVIYDGAGRFALKAPADTQLKLTLDLAALESYLGSNDYKQGPMVTWEMTMPGGRQLVYGLADTAKHLTCFWNGQAWTNDGVVAYDRLKSLAQNGKVTLLLAIQPSAGLTVSCGDEVLLKAPNLKTQLPFDTTHAYTVNTNYVSAVGIMASSSLDTSGYKAPQDYTKPVRRQGEKTLGRVMFCGDSITHGVNDQTWRWQFFKILVDNGVSAEIVGPRSGYTPGYTRLSTSDAGDSYAGVTFPNVHLAQSSGRTHNIISGSNAGMSGVNYGGHSTKSAAASFNCNTWCCLMGTNDLLSDRGYSPQDFARKMQNLLGGKVSQNAGRYTWKAGRDWGNMGRIAADLLHEEDDVLYVMAVPCWGRHVNNNEPERHEAVQQYNQLLKNWVSRYAKAHGKKLRYVDVNAGMVDSSHAVPFSWPDSMSNRPGSDGLHPNEQGSMLIAGNLARAMGLPGRTAGLKRAACDDSWAVYAKKAALRKGNRQVLLQKPFSREQGYTVELNAHTGKGELAVVLGDEAGSGTLTVTPHVVKWGGKTLYCFSPADGKKKGRLRVAWHNGMDGNRAQGYYVWVDQLLVGQALPAGAPVQLGLQVESLKGATSLSGVRCTEGSFAPVAKE